MQKKCVAFVAFVLTALVLLSGAVLSSSSFLFLPALPETCQSANTTSTTDSDSDSDAIARVLGSDAFLDHRTCTYAEGLNATPAPPGRLGWLDPKRTDKLLAGHHVLMIGDSVVRRLCAHLTQFRNRSTSGGRKGTLGVPFKFHDPGGHKTIEFSPDLTFNWHPNVASKIQRLQKLKQQLAADGKLPHDVILIGPPDHDFERENSDPATFFERCEEMLRLAAGLQASEAVKLVVIEGVFPTWRAPNTVGEESGAVLMIRLLIQHFGLAYMDMWTWVYGKNCTQRDGGGVHLSNGATRSLHMQNFLHVLGLKLGYG